jgi:phospholipid/cholesterol/gamma-HCH transport system substrate-binding protein
MRYEVKLGLFVVIGLVSLIGGYIILGNLHLLQGGTDFKMVFSNLTGLSKSSIVEIKGVKVGKINDLYLDSKGNGIVTVWVEGRYKLPNDSKFLIADLGIMGDKCIRIIPGQSKTFIKKGELIYGDLTPSFQDISKKANAISDTAQVIINRIKDSIDPETIASLKTSMTTLQKMIGSLNGMVDKNQKRIDDTFVNIKQSSNNIQRLTNQNPEQVAATLSELHRASRNLTALSNDLRVTTRQVSMLINKVDSREGTIGRLINDPSLYNNINSLILDMKKNPNRYIQIRVF